MARLHPSNVREVASNKPTSGATAFTLPDSATAPYRSFDSALATGDTVPVHASNGTAWMDFIGTFTAGTPDTLAQTTLLDSSTGSAIDWSAGGDVTLEVAWVGKLGEQVDNSSPLVSLSASPTTAGVTGVVGTMHVLDISGLTASRDFTLPATAAVGDRVGVMLSVGDASYDLLLKPDAAGTINGGSAGAEWSRLLIIGEAVIFRCVTADSAWIVEQDGRIPCYGEMTAGSGGTWDTATLTVPDFATSVADVGNVVDLANNRFTIRRGSTYVCNATALSANSPAQTTGAFAGGLYINATLGSDGYRSTYAVSGNRIQMDRTAFKTLGSSTTLSAEYQHNATNTTFFSARFIIKEVL